MRAIVASESEQSWRWWQSLDCAPLIAALHGHAERIRQGALRDHLGRLPNLSDHEKRVVETLTASIVGRLLHEPTLRLKELAGDGDGPYYAAALRELFALEEDDDGD